MDTTSPPVCSHHLTPAVPAAPTGLRRCQLAGPTGPPRRVRLTRVGRQHLPVAVHTVRPVAPLMATPSLGPLVCSTSLSYTRLTATDCSQFGTDHPTALDAPVSGRAQWLPPPAHPPLVCIAGSGKEHRRLPPELKTGARSCDTPIKRPHCECRCGRSTEACAARGATTTAHESPAFEARDLSQGNSFTPW